MTILLPCSTVSVALTADEWRTFQTKLATKSTSSKRRIDWSRKLLHMSPQRSAITENGDVCCRSAKGWIGHSIAGTHNTVKSV